MQHIGIFYNPQSSAAETSAAEFDRWLRARGLTTWRGSKSDHQMRERLESNYLVNYVCGDRTALLGAALAIPHNIPLFPVALGHLSFMAEVMPDELYHALERVLRGGFWV